MDEKKMRLALYIGGGLVLLLLIGALTGKMIAASSVCGNSVCEVGENVGNCLVDCDSICGDAICHEGENFTCKMDCANATRELPIGEWPSEGSIVFNWLSEVFE